MTSVVHRRIFAAVVLREAFWHSFACAGKTEAYVHIHTHSHVAFCIFHMSEKIFVDEITKIKKERKKNTTSNDLNMSNLFLAEKKNAICFVISMQNAHVEHCSVEMSL